MDETNNKPAKPDLVESSFTTNGAFNAEKFYTFKREVEKKMEQFDIDKKKKVADAVDDLSRLVITT